MPAQFTPTRRCSRPWPSQRKKQGAGRSGSETTPKPGRPKRLGFPYEIRSRAPVDKARSLREAFPHSRDALPAPLDKKRVL
jgi:hypothetical protein